MLRQRLFACIFFPVFCIAFSGYPVNSGAAEKDFWADMGVARIGGKKPVSAPDFTLNTLDGKKVSLKDFRGKVVFLNFWATWCPPCTFEMPSIESLHRKFKDKGLVVVAVNSEEGAKKVNNFIKKKGYTFLVLLDTDGSVANDSYKAIGFPTTYLIDRRGLAIGKAEGAREWDSKESFRLIEEILKNSKQ
ncbi:MAG: TlpA family protein disulfide reductase [Deltaproteobacteria bacterium]|nr:TlpA family protein disulfide reductase [Deltaproteobacteria bacterium]